MEVDPVGTDEPGRVAVLARRVRWLDRHRRRIARTIAILAMPLFVHEVAVVLGTDWPAFHGLLLSLTLAVLVWWTIEVALAWQTAVWETEHDHLCRNHGLPRAQLVRERRRRGA